MSTPFPLVPSMSLVLPPAYLGSVGRFAAIAAAGCVTVANAIRFDKRQKTVHRCEIADTRGRMKLTVPVAKPESATSARWSDIAVSDHGEWWPVHLTALESAYGRTPFFEFYIDRFEPFFRTFPDMPVVELDRCLELIVTDILGLPAPSYSDSPDLAVSALPSLSDNPGYWQVRGGSLGFIGGLSVLDLIFNLGPESQVYLRDYARSLFNIG